MNTKIFCFIFFLVTGQIALSFSQNLPIKPARTISFTTDEGSYMDVDLSPNGKTIVFDILGDIFTIPVEGGDATQLTRGLAYNRYPTWSPDSKQIAFISDRSGANRLDVMNADGTGERTVNLAARQVLPGDPVWQDDSFPMEAVPAWTPDGQFIAVEDSLYNFAGGAVKLPKDIRCNVQFTGDGSAIYYEKPSSESDTARAVLYSYSRADSHITKITSIPVYFDSWSNHDGWWANQSVSPDGKWLAYIAGANPASSLRIRNLETGEDRMLKDGIDSHNRIFSEHFCFSGDSKNIFIGFGGKLHRIGIAGGNDQIIPFSARVNADLGAFDYHTFKVNDTDSLQVKVTHNAVRSPDGKSLAYIALNRIYTMSLPYGKPKVLVNQSMVQFDPEYSPDGKWIAYSSWSDTKGGYVWKVPATGGKPEQLTTIEGTYRHLAWSPDGKKLAIINDFGQNSQIAILDIPKRTLNILADSVSLWFNQVSFSPDGTHILTVADREDGSAPVRLIAVSLSGGTKRALATSTADEYKMLVHEITEGMMQMTISPDNRYIVYGINEDLYITPVPGLGAPDTLNSRTASGLTIRFAVGGLDPHWEQGGKVLSWSYGNHYYNIDPDKIMERALTAAKDSAEKGVAFPKFYKLAITPDQDIFLNVKAQKAYGKGTIALKDARIISMKGNEVIEDGTIVITNGRISSIGGEGNVNIPAGAKIYDLRGKTITPGLIDLHDHIGGRAGEFPQQWPPYLVDLAYGVTTARDPSSTFEQFAYSELLQTGQMIGPRLFSVGRSVGEGNIVIDSYEKAKETVGKRAELGATVIKQYLQQTRLQRQWVLMACEAYGLNMTNEGNFDPRGELMMMKDGTTGVEHAYGWGSVYNDVIEFVARSGIWHTPTLRVASGGNADQQEEGLDYFRNQYRLHPDKKLPYFDGVNPYQNASPTDTALSNMIYTSSIEAKIAKAGGHIGMGAHGNDQGIGSHWETWSLQMGGLTNMEALHEATIGGAEAIGIQQDLGSLEVGKIADLMILDKNPLDDIHNTMSIKYVMKDGILYNGDNLDELWPLYKKLPDWKFHSKTGTAYRMPTLHEIMGTVMGGQDDEDK